jgi:hypothetical protein
MSSVWVTLEIRRATSIFCMMRFYSLGLVFLLACSGSESGPSGGSSGASPPSANGSCTPLFPVAELAPLPAEVESLAVGDDALYTIDRTSGATVVGGKSGVVLRVPKDGSAAIPYYTPEGGRRIQSIRADGPDLFIAEGDPAASNGAVGRIVKSTNRVVTELLPTGVSKALVNLFASDGSYLYLEQEARRSGFFGIYRLAKAGGALETVVEVDSGAFLSTQLVGNEFVFNAQVTKLYRVSKDNAGAPVTSIGQKTCETGYAATADAIYCGRPNEVEKTGPRFEAPSVVLRTIDVPLLKDSSAVGASPRLVTDRSVYVQFTPGGKKAPLIELDRATSSPKPALCEIGWVGGLGVDATSLYALQVRDEKFNFSAKLYKTAR